MFQLKFLLCPRLDKGWNSNFGKIWVGWNEEFPQWWLEGEQKKGETMGSSISSKICHLENWGRRRLCYLPGFTDIKLKNHDLSPERELWSMMTHSACTCSVTSYCAGVLLGVITILPSLCNVRQTLKHFYMMVLVLWLRQMSGHSYRKMVWQTQQAAEMCLRQPLWDWLRVLRPASEWEEGSMRLAMWESAAFAEDMRVLRRMPSLAMQVSLPWYYRWGVCLSSREWVHSLIPQTFYPSMNWMLFQEFEICYNPKNQRVYPF